MFAKYFLREFIKKNMDWLKAIGKRCAFNNCLKCSDTECLKSEQGFYLEEVVRRRFGIDYDACSTLRLFSQ